jgi:hypothetical protein
MDQPWFRPKRFGYGAGLPLNWKGWLLTVAYVGSLIGLALGARGWLPRYAPELNPRVALMVAVAVISIPFLLVMKAKTEGGWQWRSGRD